MCNGMKPLSSLVSGILLGTMLMAGCVDDDPPRRSSDSLSSGAPSAGVPPGGGFDSGETVDGKSDGGSPDGAEPNNGNPSNGEPTIHGTPATSAFQAQRYEFQPTASGVDRDALSFTIANKPAWATFNPATGRLTGIPGPADVGIHSNIEISVTDGKTTKSLPPFTLAVMAANSGTYSATVQWLPPAQKTDGTALGDLAGYRIYYGTAPGQYSSSITLKGSGLTSYVVSDLPGGTYYFSVTALDSSGAESDRSKEVSKTFN